MKDRVEKAKKAIQDVIQEFEPAKGHAVGAGREMLLAMRSVIDAQLKLYDRATAAAKPEESETPPTTTIPVEEEPPAGPDHPA
jgi:hypothetical protein